MQRSLGLFVRPSALFLVESRRKRHRWPSAMRCPHRLACEVPELSLTLARPALMLPIYAGRRALTGNEHRIAPDPVPPHAATQLSHPILFLLSEDRAQVQIGDPYVVSQLHCLNWTR